MNRDRRLTHRTGAPPTETRSSSSTPRVCHLSELSPSDSALPVDRTTSRGCFRVASPAPSGLSCSAMRPVSRAASLAYSFASSAHLSTDLARSVAVRGRGYSTPAKLRSHIRLPLVRRGCHDPLYPWSPSACFPNTLARPTPSPPCSRLLLWVSRSKHRRAARKPLSSSPPSWRALPQGGARPTLCRPLAVDQQQLSTSSHATG